MISRESIRSYYLLIASTVFVAAVFAALGIVSLAVAGCTSTVTPAVVIPQHASYSGTQRNSGEIAAAPGGRIIDGNLRVRYNALIARYGAQYQLKPDAGLVKLMDGATPDAERWFIDLQHWSAFLHMNVDLHSAIAPRQP